MLLGISPLRLSTAKRNRKPWGGGGATQRGSGQGGGKAEGQGQGPWEQQTGLPAQDIHLASAQLSATALPHSLGPPPTSTLPALICLAFLWIPASGHWLLPSLSRPLSVSLFLQVLFLHLPRSRTSLLSGCLSSLSDLFPLKGSLWPGPRGRWGRPSSRSCCFCHCCGWLQVRWG